MKHSILGIVVLTFILSCSDGYKMKFPEERKGSIKYDKEIDISIPLEIIKSGNLLLYSDFRSDSLLKIYDISGKKIIKNAIPYGEGPAESLSPIQIVLKDSILYVHNRWHYSMKKYVLKGNASSLILKESIFHLPFDIDMIYPLNDSTCISSGRFKEGRFAIIDKNGRICSFFGTYPNFKPRGEDKIPNFPKFMFHQSMFAAKDNLLACSTRHVLDIYDFSKISNIRLKKRILLSSYDYSYEEGDGWAKAYSTKGIDTGVKRVSVTNKYIYLLYDSSPIYENEKNKKEIWIFDWNGNPIKKIDIENELITFCVDENDRTLFGIANIPEPTIIHIKL